jgi:hypothetical protein
VLGCFRLKTAYGDTARLIELKTAKRQLEAEIPTTLVMEDKPTDKPLTAVVRPRGEFTRQGEVVETGVPAVLHPFPSKARRAIDWGWRSGWSPAIIHSRRACR